MYVKVKMLTKTAKMPSFQTTDAAGADIYADKPEIIPPGHSRLISTGISLEIPRGFEAQVRPRSGLAARANITVLNSPGTIDADYRGEIKVLIINHGKHDFYVDPGVRIAQLVFARVESPSFIVVEELDETDRAAGGFGSTGV